MLAHPPHRRDMECSTGSSSLLRLDARELDHLAPLVGFVDNELGEVGR
jgi:hypothetical protein